MQENTALLSIPVFPPIALRLMQLLGDEDVALGEVLELLRSDPGFSAEILRRANSPLYGTKEPVTTLHHALVVLGLRQLRGLTLTVAAEMYLSSALHTAELRRCWRHTVACALVTEELARACSMHQDLAYTAGLMHDIGRLGLLVAEPERYSRLIGPSAAADADLLPLERAEFGLDHCEAGHWLATEWNLPEAFRAIAWRHHEPPSPELDVVSLVSLGCRLADTLGFDVAPGKPRATWAEIRALLPPAAASRLPDEPAALRLLVETRIQALAVDQAERDAPAERHEAGHAHAGPHPWWPRLVLTLRRLFSR